MCAASRDGRLRLHKAKQNANGSFSIGKSWSLEEMRTVEVIKVSQIPAGHLTIIKPWWALTFFFV